MNTLRPVYWQSRMDEHTCGPCRIHHGRVGGGDNPAPDCENKEHGCRCMVADDVAVLEITVSDQEIVVSKFSYQTALHILQDKGAPVLGVLYLIVDPAFEVSYIEDVMNNKKIYKFKRTKS